MKKNPKKRNRIPRGYRAPKVLSEYEVGKCVQGILSVRLMGKPMVEIGCRYAQLADLNADLTECLRQENATDLKVWVSKDRMGCIHYGFYREPWVHEALDFLERENLAQIDRDWIAGLLFGYRADEIQKFIDDKYPKHNSTKRATKR